MGKGGDLIRFNNPLNNIINKKKKFMSWESYSDKIAFLDQFHSQQDIRLKNIHTPS